MKNKRTKLTAILLSALMAVCTISSVTWAADLFSDGDDASEPAVEESVVPFSNETITEESESFDNDVLLNVDESSVDYVTWDQDDEYDPLSPQASDFTSGVYLGLDGKYHLPIKYYDAADQLLDTGEAILTPTGSVKATCEKPAFDKFEFEAAGKTYRNVRLYHKDGWEYGKVHNYVTDYFAYTAPTCDRAGEGINYYYCPDCGKFGYLDGTSYKFDKDASGLTPEQYYQANKSSIPDDTYFIKVTIPPTGHHALDPQKDVVPPYDSSYNDYKVSGELVQYGYAVGATDGNGKNNPELVKDGDPVRDHFEKLANCKKQNGIFSGAMDPTRDAYYYEFTRCKDCGATISIYRRTFNSTNITEGDKFYRAGENVFGFLGTDGNIYADIIPEGKFESVIVENCEIGGVYYLCTASKDFTGDIVENDYSVVEEKTVPKGHNWDPYPFIYETDSKGVVIDENPTNLYGPNHQSLKSKEYKIGNTSYGTHKYADKDENGEYLVYSKDCSTPAYYTVVQHCLNPNCPFSYNKKSNDTVYYPRKAKFGDHVWYTEDQTDVNGHPLRYVDPEQTKYEYVDENHHLEHYYDHVECSICHQTSIEKSNKADALMKHTFAPREIKALGREEANCGNPGFYYRAQACQCLKKADDPESFYYDEDTVTKATIPATDQHDFGDNPAQIVWSGGSDGEGAVYIADSFVPGVSLHADIVRKCTVCGKLDSNYINTMQPKDPNGADVEIINSKSNRGSANNGKADPDHYDYTTLDPAGRWCATLRVRDLEPAKTDPATGISYRCSTAHATIYVDWVGTVKGKLVKLNEDEVDNAVKVNVPYYKSEVEYQARTSHTPGKPQKEGDEIITRCTVCGDIVKRETDTSSSIGVPTVSAASADFDTVNVSWTKVDGATAYRLYYRSSDAGISKWTKIRTFTGETTSYPVNGLTTGSKYRFTVRAEVTQDGKTTLGDYSKKGAVAVPKLTAPEIKSVTASGKTTKVTWSRVDGASGYIVFRNSQRVGTVTKGSKVTWTDKKPVSGAKYQVRAYRTEAKKNFKSDLSEPK